MGPFWDVCLFGCIYGKIRFSGLEEDPMVENDHMKGLKSNKTNAEFLRLEPFRPAIMS